MKSNKIIKIIGMSTAGIFGAGAIAIPTLVLSSCSTSGTQISVATDKPVLTQDRTKPQIAQITTSVISSTNTGSITLTTDPQVLPAWIHLEDYHDGTGNLTLDPGEDVTSPQKITVIASCDGVTSSVSIMVSRASTEISVNAKKNEIVQDNTSQNVEIEASLSPKGIPVTLAAEIDPLLSNDISFKDNGDGTGVLSVAAGTAITQTQTITITATCKGVIASSAPATIFVYPHDIYDNFTYSSVPGGKLSVAAHAGVILSGELIIPSTYAGKPVVKIFPGGFKNQAGITGLRLPNSIASIGNNAFDCCESLTSLVVPNSVTEIGSYAFQYCTSLKNIVIPDSTILIMTAAFIGCPLTSITIDPNNPTYKKATNVGPNATVIVSNGNELNSDCSNSVEGLVCGDLILHDNVTAVNFRAFELCYGITGITLTSNITKIESYAFSKCINLTKVALPASLDTISNLAFEDCSSLTSIHIPDTVTLIGDYAFKKCPLTSITIDPNNPTYKKATNVGPDATVIVSNGNELNSDCSNVVGSLACGDLIFPNTVTSVNTKNFHGCGGITSIIFNTRLTNIIDEAFIDCINLTKIILQKNVASIGVGAFYNCPLTSIILNSENKTYKKATNVGSNATVIVKNTDTLASDCSNVVSGLACGAIVFPDTVTTVSSGAFFGCAGITSIEFSPKISAILTNAFAYCINLTTVKFSDNYRPAFVYNESFIYCNINIKFYVPWYLVSEYQTQIAEDRGWTTWYTDRIITY